jgi:adenylate kinase
MHYCQRCDEPRLMVPDGNGIGARCPSCGNLDPRPVIRPLFVVTGASGSGKTTIFPELLGRLPGRPWVGDIHFLVLDCPDDLRRRRIEARPPWRHRDTDDQTRFGRRLRENLSPVIDTSQDSPSGVAETVTAWVLGRIKTG